MRKKWKLSQRAHRGRRNRLNRRRRDLGGCANQQGGVSGMAHGSWGACAYGGPKAVDDPKPYDRAKYSKPYFQGLKGLGF